MSKGLRPFVHLHVHTEYSILDGACRTAELAAQAAEWGMPAVAITDHGNMFGAIEFYHECQARGINPILGCEVYVAPGSRFERQRHPQYGFTSSHFLVLAKNFKGYENLVQLVSRSYLEGFYYKPRIDWELLGELSEGLIATSACMKSEIAQCVLGNDIRGAERLIGRLIEIFGRENFYLEIQNHSTPEEKRLREAYREIGKRLGVNLVASNDVHYLRHEDQEMHDLLLCIQTGAHRNNPDRLRYDTDQLWFKDARAMNELFIEFPDALENTLRIAEQCKVELPFGLNRYPKYRTPNGLSPEAYLEQLCLEGMQRRYQQSSDVEKASIEKRLRYELEIIEKSGFTSYFLVVWDFIRYAREQRIPVGPGRGSAAGSLISYVLGITNVDPLKYGLFFERFLNPERVSPPDIDVDFCTRRRDEVIQYVIDKYGRDCVAQIATFGTIKAKNAIRDVARALGLSFSDGDRLARLVPERDLKFTLKGESKGKEGFRAIPELARLYDEDDQVREVINFAVAIEGLTRQVGIHASAVVIADEDLSKVVPIYQDDKGVRATQYAMDYVAELGLLKMDFLGLKNLTVIEDAVRLIEKSKGVRVDMDQIPLDDPRAFAIIANAQNTGIFQLESSGMCEVCRKVKPQTIGEISDVLALFRPGPMENIPTYVRRKFGQEPIVYPHPLLEPILKETYGVIIYQEQVMQAANVLAGYSLGEADMLRRAMGKKKPEEMARQRERFVRGCQECHQIEKRLAEEIFDTLERFAGYGFNKSHSVAYALVAYQTAWLKAHYPVEFMAALMSNAKDTDEVVPLVQEARGMGIKVLPPCIQKSDVRFTVEDDAIRFGLAAIRGVGEGAAEEIVRAREGKGEFRSLDDLCERIAGRSFNKKCLEALIKTGALDALGLSRKRLYNKMDESLARASMRARERSSGQVHLFGDVEWVEENELEKSEEKRGEEWGMTELLNFEREYLGFYFSGHPLNSIRDEIEELSTACIADLQKGEQRGGIVRIGVIVSSVEVALTRRDKRPWAKLVVEDLSGTAEAFVSSSVYEKLREGIETYGFYVVTARVDWEEEALRLHVQEIVRLDEARRLYYQAVILRVNVEQAIESVYRDLVRLFLRHPGKARVLLQIACCKGGEVTVECRMTVNPVEAFLKGVESILGKGHVRFVSFKQAANNGSSRVLKNRQRGGQALSNA